VVVMATRNAGVAWGVLPAVRRYGADAAVSFVRLRIRESCAVSHSSHVVGWNAVIGETARYYRHVDTPDKQSHRFYLP
jgi:hypothetical protein